MNDKKIVFIIGNGFDLDLGWKTTFSQFANSPYWPQSCEMVSHLYNLLNTNRQRSMWFDIEKLMADYVDTNSRRTLPNRVTGDKLFFNKLTHALISYLAEQQKMDVSRDSTAAKVLSAVLSVRRMAKIYSFNYTDLHIIADKLGITSYFDYEHVHGDLKDETAIVGIPDSVDVVENYEFMYKTFSPYYSSHEILFDLLDADEVIFFGHSLGQIDYHYFQRFFQQQCRSDMQRLDGKRITIFTYDLASRISILKQLREMNQKRTDLLFNQNALNIFMTDGTDDEKIAKFLSDFIRRAKRKQPSAFTGNIISTAQ